MLARKKVKTPTVLYVDTYPPRECGIATFTQDLTKAIDSEFASVCKTKILAMNDNGTSLYNYPSEVVAQINDSDLADYLQRAQEINKSAQIKLVNIQHEYGIFGGDWGNYILPFLEILTKPVVITMHTVLPRPGKQLKKITQDLVNRASGVVVMTKHAAHLLRAHYHIDPKKPLAVIPHGVHNIPFPSKTEAKKSLHLSGRTVLSTFGMLNVDKGIEYAIAALPELVKTYPNLIYLVLGATHPVVARQEGERYRNKLVKLVNQLGLSEHVKFYNKYLDLPELIAFLKATDIYISPTLNPKQAVSGTVSYALSCACAIVSTANQYAKDSIDSGRGLLVEFASAPAIEKALATLLADQKMTKELQRGAYFYSRHMTFQNVALAYFKFFNGFAKIAPRQSKKWPPISLAHIKRLTDDFGMIQFANHTRPDKHSGYCLDDNARALIGCLKLNEQRDNPSALQQAQIYFQYLIFSQKSNGHFYDFVYHNRHVNEESESEDSFGRAIWALGEVLQSQHAPAAMKQAALLCLTKAWPHLAELRFSRAIAFALLGLVACHKAKVDLPEIRSTMKFLADKLLQHYAEQNSQTGGQNWRWFDGHLTYSNFKIPQSLFLVYSIIGEADYLRVAGESLEFLCQVAFDKGYYNAIGQDGWYFRDGKRAYFDQQPEDAASAVEALVAAWRVTGDKNLAEQAKLAFAWFLGKNHLNQMIYDEATGGCYDGLGKYSLNFNQGAESTLSYFLARLAISKLH